MNHTPTHASNSERHSDELSPPTHTAFYTNESFYNREMQTYLIARITAGEAGYVASPGAADLTTARAEADALNTEAGLTKDQVYAIVASSMARGEVHR